MREVDELLAGIGAELRRGDAPLARVARQSKAYDLFEVYLLMLTVRAARSLSSDGVSVRFRTFDGKAPRAIVFRRSPGHIFNNRLAFTHAEISSASHGGVLEAHVGIYVRGRSSRVHECDVAVVPTDVASRCRTDREVPSYRKLVVATEAKFLAIQTTPLGYGRAFLGLAAEIAYPGQLTLASTKPNDAITVLVRQHQKTNARFYGRVSADVTERETQNYVEHVREELRRWAA